MFRSRSWFGAWNRPKNPHSLERLKYLHNILSKNTTITESNRGTLVESLRCIAEILIWGDQNDSSVFDFFLEKNMLSYFLKIMRQKCGGSSFVCVQLLQTLNILFENIRNETSLYYLLSNNHVNSIIIHKFDFSDEEVMAYYISFLKTLSLKLNNHTIHFFYNENTKDFPLYTEAIKFFNHPESMVRIAVRTLTLNVYRVRDPSMLKFIRDRTAAPYFSNLVWFIGKHILELDLCVRNDADHQSQQKLDDLVAEHLDHLHYINDILCLNIPDLNDVLTEHLLHKLFIPLYVYSLVSVPSKWNSPAFNRSNSDPKNRHLDILMAMNAEMMPGRLNLQRPSRSDADDDAKPNVSCIVALFLLSQVFLIITHGPIVYALAWIILECDASVFEEGGAKKMLEVYLVRPLSVKLEFAKPQVSLEMALENVVRDYTSPVAVSSRKLGVGSDPYNTDHSSCDLDPELVSTSLPSTSHISEASSATQESTEDLITQVQSTPVAKSVGNSENLPDSPLPDSGIESNSSGPTDATNITDEEKQKLLNSLSSTTLVGQALSMESVLDSEVAELKKKPFLKVVLDSLDCSENDYRALFALCLLYALVNNKGVNQDLLDQLVSSRDLADDQKDPQSQAQPREVTDSSRPDEGEEKPCYNALLVDRLLAIVNNCCKTASKVRIVTLELSVTLLRAAVLGEAGCSVPRYGQRVDAARARAAALARSYYKSDDIFLDMFEDEYSETCKRPLNVECLCMDAAILLPPTRTPMSGIAFEKRLPSGEVERARRAIRTFFLVRDLYMKVAGKTESQLPLSNPAPFVQVGNVLDLNDSDLISCDIIQKDGGWQHRFLAVDNMQIILVEPDKQRLGWGVAKLVGSLQDLEIQGDKEDPRCLHLTIHKPRVGPGAHQRTVILRAKFKFDDHIRSMAAKQRLTKGRTKSRQKKMQQIGRLLEVAGVAAGLVGATSSLSTSRHRPLLSGSRLPGFPMPRTISGVESEDGAERRLRRPSAHLLKEGVIVYRERPLSRDRGSRSSSMSGSREGSPRPRVEDIPLETMRRGGQPAPAPAPPAESLLPAATATPAVVQEAAVPSSPQPSTPSEETSFISQEPEQRRRKGTRHGPAVVRQMGYGPGEAMNMSAVIYANKEIKSLH